MKGTCHAVAGAGVALALALSALAVAVGGRPAWVFPVADVLPIVVAVITGFIGRPLGVLEAAWEGTLSCRC
jgi:hypothetical protein